MKRQQKLNTETGEIIIEEPLYYNNPRNYRERMATIKRFESNSGISDTVPNQALTVRETIERYAQGIPITNFVTPQYEADSDGQPTTVLDINQWSKMDFSQREEYYDRVIEQKLQAEADLKRKAAEKIEARRKREYEAQIENEIKRRLQEAKKKQGDSGASESQS